MLDQHRPNTQSEERIGIYSFADILHGAGCAIVQKYGKNNAAQRRSYACETEKGSIEIELQNTIAYSTITLHCKGYSIRQIEISTSGEGVFSLQAQLCGGLCIHANYYSASDLTDERYTTLITDLESIQDSLDAVHGKMIRESKKKPQIKNWRQAFREWIFLQLLRIHK